MPAIEISGLRHVYANGHVALADINLQANDGEFLALLGPSGSGKTTLLRSIAGFLRPEAGSLRIGGETVAGDGAWLPPERRKLGMVFQNHAIWPHWSVARNVGYPLKLAGVPRAEAARRVQAVLDQVGLGRAVQQVAESLDLVLVEQVVEVDALPAAVELAAYRIAAEALTNVARHAGTRSVRLALRTLGETLVLSVADDGVGPSGGTAVSGATGLGTSTMRERAEELGGTLTVRPGDEGGTVVTAVLPLTATARTAVPEETT